MPDSQDIALLDSVILGSARGGKKPLIPQTISVVRPLTLDDVPMLVAPPPVAADRPGQYLKLRHGHHSIARNIAEGRTLEEVALITGYSIAYMSDLKNNPAFAELLAYYAANKELVFVDVAERMKALGLNALDELQDRLATEPEGFAKRELMELAELMLVKGRTPLVGGSGGGPGVNINVKFVDAGERKREALVDITPEPGNE